MFLEFEKGTFRTRTVAAQKKKYRQFFDNRALHIPMEKTACARGESVKIYRRMRVCRGRDGLAKTLFRIASAGIENGQPKLGRLVRCHRTMLFVTSGRLKNECETLIAGISIRRRRGR